MHTNSQQFSLQSLSQDAWRLCDGTVSDGDAESVVAYIERGADGAYIATWISRRAGTTRYASMDDLLRDAAGWVHEPAHVEAQRPTPIPHRPPFTARRP